MPENKQDHKFETIQSTPFTGEFQNIWENKTSKPLKDILEAQEFIRKRKEVHEREKLMIAELLKSKFSK